VKIFDFITADSTVVNDFELSLRSHQLMKLFLPSISLKLYHKLATILYTNEIIRGFQQDANRAVQCMCGVYYSILLICLCVTLINKWWWW